MHGSPIDCAGIRTRHFGMQLAYLEQYQQHLIKIRKQIPNNSIQL